MNARRSILGASIGVLLLAPAPVEDRDPGPESPSRELSNVNTCVEQQGPVSAAASVNRLSTAYAPQEVGSTDTARVAAPIDLKEPTLWLARAIYSETKLPHE
ncbi:MAG: hypothetical protein V5A20_02810, partial [Salinibacter sp.]